MLSKLGEFLSIVKSNQIPPKIESAIFIQLFKMMNMHIFN